MDNRRKSTRISLVTIARITPQGLQTATEALVRDISAGGIGVYAKGRYQKGDLLLIKLSFTTDQGQTISESLAGRIAWLKPLDGENQSAVGIQIQDMERKHPTLYAYIQRLEAK
jgi:Tfp pilus assembly protein PilZ